eukprot:scaffold89924_cov18-Tisochrysis_lutea.AAC.1
MLLQLVDQLMRFASQHHEKLEVDCLRWGCMRLDGMSVSGLGCQCWDISLCASHPSTHALSDDQCLTELAASLLYPGYVPQQKKGCQYWCASCAPPCLAVIVVHVEC